MDLNFPEMKQDHSAAGAVPKTIDNDTWKSSGSPISPLKKFSDASFDLLGDIQQETINYPAAAGKTYRDDQMSFGTGSDFEHIKSHLNMDEEFLGNSRNSDMKFSSGPAASVMADLTRDFMNIERGGYSENKPMAPSAPISVDDFLMESDSLEENKKPTEAQPQQKNHMYDFDEDFKATTGLSADSEGDIDSDSQPVSCNPSPVKKNTITQQLKEQDNEKFISSEDLLGDFKEERTSTPEFHAATESNIGNKTATGLQDKKTVTDLDDIVKPTPVNSTHSKVDDIKEPPLPEIPAQKPITPPPSTEKSDKISKGPNIVSVEEMFYKYGLDAWFKPERLHPIVESLIYWRDVKKSGVVFGAGLATLLAISCFSVISVFAYLSLITLIGTIGFRVYKTVMQAIQKTSDGHPFKELLELDLTLSQEKAQQICTVAVAHTNGFVAELRRLFLVEDLVDSMKFLIILWVLTHVGAWFNGMTLVILAFVSLFTLPKVYENNKQSIDTYLDLARSKLTEISDRFKAAIPIGTKKPIAAESDKDK